MQSPASRKLRKSALILVVAYEAVFLSVFYAVHRLHPVGAPLVVLAVLPVLPLMVLFAAFGQYLRDEKDGYKRDLAVRCVLWGAAGSVSLHLFLNFLRIFDWKGQPPPFSELWAFAAMMMVAKFSYRAANRVPADA